MGMKMGFGFLNENGTERKLCTSPEGAECRRSENKIVVAKTVEREWESFDFGLEPCDDAVEGGIAEYQFSLLS